MKRFFWINLHYACFGIETTSDVVTSAPPIGKWMIGKTLDEMKEWFIKNKSEIHEIDQNKVKPTELHCAVFDDTFSIGDSERLEQCKNCIEKTDGESCSHLEIK